MSPGPGVFHHFQPTMDNSSENFLVGDCSKHLQHFQIPPTTFCSLRATTKISTQPCFTVKKHSHRHKNQREELKMQVLLPPNHGLIFAVPFTSPSFAQDFLGFADEIPIILHLSQQVLYHTAPFLVTRAKGNHFDLWLMGQLWLLLVMEWKNPFHLCLHFKGKILKRTWDPGDLLHLDDPALSPPLYPKSPLNSNLSLAQGKCKAWVALLGHIMK